MQPDELADVLTNSDYILFDNKYEEVLRSLGERVRLRPVTVTDGVRQLVWHHYLEVRIRQEASTDAVLFHTTPGLEIYRYGQDSVFVSEPLRDELKKGSRHASSFSSALSRFAG